MYSEKNNNIVHFIQPSEAHERRLVKQLGRFEEALQFDTFPLLYLHVSYHNING